MSGTARTRSAASAGASPPAPRHARALVWFRRDLRDFDHAALYHALKHSGRVFCAFVFDREILDALPRDDRRVALIHANVVELAEALGKRGGALIIRHGAARDVVPALARELAVGAVYFNHDYEPVAGARDNAVSLALERDGIATCTFKDQVIFERAEILTRAGRPLTVFTPYRNAWMAALTPFFLRAYDVDRYAGALAAPSAGVATAMPSLAALGFDGAAFNELKIRGGMAGAAQRFAAFRERLDDYDTTRNFPALDATSRLSPDLRFGTLSIRALAAHAHARALHGSKGAATWLSELIWRDFFAQILWHFPRVVHEPFNAAYAALRFPVNDGHFQAWCEGRTGYPLVDAAMRELNTTGFMHNRLRMVAASFLVKDLLVDWRLGERYFAAQLLDYDLASNNGNWQWAASTGCDAQPYFRIFNPVTQSERFDPDGAFIRRFVPELARMKAPQVHAPWLPTKQQGAPKPGGPGDGGDYPPPRVDHAQARTEALALYRGARP
jgi:deoxyribodipyrimidine photo-lyase